MFFNTYQLTPLLHKQNSLSYYIPIFTKTRIIEGKTLFNKRFGKLEKKFHNCRKHTFKVLVINYLRKVKIYIFHHIYLEVNKKLRNLAVEKIGWCPATRKVQQMAYRDCGRQRRNITMKTVMNYDDESYELDNVYNDDDMYGEWYGYRNNSVQTDDTLYLISGNETSIWYN